MPSGVLSGTLCFSVDTVRAASDVLKAVLATKTGATFATDYKQKVADHFFQYLQPFRTRSKKVCNSNQSAISHNSCINL